MSNLHILQVMNANRKMRNPNRATMSSKKYCVLENFFSNNKLPQRVKIS